MKRNRLVVEYTYPFELIGITSSVKFYTLAWGLNKALAVDFVKETEDFVLDFRNKPQHFELYSYPAGEPSLFLFRNKSVNTENQYLVPELPHFDYVLKLPAESTSFSLKEITEVLRDLSMIEYIGALDVNTLKSRDNFLD